MPEPAARRGTVLAFDFGVKRIGVAVGELETKQAHPLATIREERNDRRFAAIAALVGEWRPALLVVGRPVALDGSAHAMTRLCERFAGRLRARFGIEVAPAEERLTSAEAEERLRDSGYNTRFARRHVDTLAAQIILQSYLDRLPETQMESCHASTAHAA